MHAAVDPVVELRACTALTSRVLASFRRWWLQHWPLTTLGTCNLVGVTSLADTFSTSRAAGPLSLGRLPPRSGLLSPGPLRIHGTGRPRLQLPPMGWCQHCLAAARDANAISKFGGPTRGGRPDAHLLPTLSEMAGEDEEGRRRGGGGGFLVVPRGLL